jgi:Uma2 family endonuclease
LPTDERPSSLVPDVAYISFAPDIAVEIWSTGDKHGILREKIGLYVEHGSQLVIVVDPEDRSVTMHEAGEAHVFRDGDVARSVTYPDLALDVMELLA